MKTILLDQSLQDQLQENAKKAWKQVQEEQRIPVEQQTQEEQQNQMEPLTEIGTAETPKEDSCLPEDAKNKPQKG